MVAAIAIAGCGSSHAVGTSADPAGVTPASAPLYASAIVRPNSTLKTAALSAGRALTGQTNPFLRLLPALQTPGSKPLDFKRDLTPWLGPRAGIFLTSLNSSSSLTSLLAQGLLGNGGSGSFPFGASAAQGAIVLDTSDADKARAFLDSQAERAGAHASSYRGIAYKATSGGVAFALVHRFAVIGSEAGLHSVIDTALGGSPALANASSYAKLLHAAPTGALASLYSNPAASKSESTAQEGLSGLLALLAGTREANVSFVPKADSITLDADTLSASSGPASGGLLATDPQSAEALSELPGESWLAIGLGHLSRSLSADVQGLRALASLTGSLAGGPPSPETSTGTTLGFSSLVEAMVKPLSELGSNSARAKRDFASWMGSAGIFTAGGSLLELKAGVVIASKDAARSRAAVAKLGERLRKQGGIVESAKIHGADTAIGVRLTGLPLVLDIAAGTSDSGQARFVLGLGEASTETALKSSNTLAQASTRSAGASALGEGAQPSILVDFPTLLTLLESVGLSEDPSISKIVPYLRAATTLAGGGHDLGGGVERFRLVLGLTQQNLETETEG